MMYALFVIMCSMNAISHLVAKPSTTSQSRLTLLDQIDVVVCTQDSVDVITRSDVERPALQGSTRTVDDLVFESLVFLDAKKHKIDPDDDAVDRYLAKIMQENGLTLAELEDIFHQGGRTLKEGREELRKMQAVNGMLDFKIRSNVLVAKHEVEAYYHDNPEYEPERYELQYALVAYDSERTRSDQKKELEKQCAAQNHSESKVRFGNPFWVDAQDIAQDRQSISRLSVDAVAIFESPEGFEIYRMNNRKERTLRSLQDRYRDIVNVLTQPKYQQMMEQYRKQLIDDTSVLYLQ